MKTEMKDRIRSRRVQLDMTQLTLAKKLGVSRVSVTKWENGTTKPDGENLHQLAGVLQVTPEWILYGKGDADVDDIKLVPFLKPPTAVPIISAVQAGLWTETYASSRLTDVIAWTQTTANVSDEVFGLVVRGESMTNPHGLPSIPEGSIVIVEPHFGQIDDLYGKIVVATLEGSTEATVKKLVWDSPFAYLMPLNPAFKPIQIDGNCRIVGKVVQITQNI
ncbi:helix-turn-helix domain-containing protein [Escherichia coli]|uniref:LexA family protein n=1 Tax=Escherichia coli TaxID=562 RepID=UPI00159707C5|nr:S24 family peptidase [Escherichia coli]DAJ95719.1 MAG TPA: Repressor protein CI [Caudoviricetes sp.]ELH3079358.1 helix-turn-helix domain-containing protein [Escherichia coli]ELI7332894.1 helix-turn-helix domain-containing protein [Escherichia coli]MDA5353242.1 helix-turn-helix domain-containing protein [Escherichia coli]MDA6764002.1 helix-turn-helix domain-containing protein [Escherichia coli]